MINQSFDEYLDELLHLYQIGTQNYLKAKGLQHTQKEVKCELM